MKYWTPALRLFIFMTVLTGIVYPLVVTGVAQMVSSAKANGSLLETAGELRGSELIVQKFVSERYFWPRPSVNDYNPQASGGSNLGQDSKELQKKFSERKSQLSKSHPGEGNVPADLLFASGSGLDPEISPEAALFQANRIAHVRNLDVSAVRQLITRLTQPRQMAILGEPRVNVLNLNLALDQIH